MANEKRLIDANALITNLRTFKGLGAVVAETLVRFVKKQPTVDAVEVVRCKDCHWWRHINKKNGCGICFHEVFYIDDPTTAPITEPNDFCSHGERKDNGT